MENEIQSLRNEISRLEETNRNTEESSHNLELTLRSQINSLEKSLTESGDQTNVRITELEV